MRKLPFFIYTKMSALITKLEQLKTQQEELEKRIQDENEQKRLAKIGLSHLKKLNKQANDFIKTSGKGTSNSGLMTACRTRRIIIFSTREKFETLYEIIKKQDERIKNLESCIA